MKLSLQSQSKAKVSVVFDKSLFVPKCSSSLNTIACVISPVIDRQSQPQSGFVNPWVPPRNNYEDKQLQFTSLSRGPSASSRGMDDSSPAMAPNSIWGDFGSPHGMQHFRQKYLILPRILISRYRSIVCFGIAFARQQATALPWSATTLWGHFWPWSSERPNFWANWSRAATHGWLSWPNASWWPSAWHACQSTRPWQENVDYGRGWSRHVS